MTDHSIRPWKQGFCRIYFVLFYDKAIFFYFLPFTLLIDSNFNTESLILLQDNYTNSSYAKITPDNYILINYKYTVSISIPNSHITQDNCDNSNYSKINSDHNIQTIEFTPRAYKHYTVNFSPVIAIIYLFIFSIFFSIF